MCAYVVVQFRFFTLGIFYQGPISCKNESDEIPLTICDANLNYKAKAMQRVAFQMMVLIELLDLGRFLKATLA